MLKITSVVGIGHAEEQNIRFRKTMEDSVVMIDKFGNNPDLGYFAVFDGHGGPEAAKSAAEHAHKILIEDIIKQFYPVDEQTPTPPQQLTQLSPLPATPKMNTSKKLDIDMIENY